MGYSQCDNIEVVKSLVQVLWFWRCLPLNILQKKIWGILCVSHWCQIVLKHNVEHSCELNPPDSADLLTFHPHTIMRLKTLVQTEMFQPRHEIWISNCNFRYQLHYCDIYIEVDLNTFHATTFTCQV